MLLDSFFLHGFLEVGVLLVGPVQGSKQPCTLVLVVKAGNIVSRIVVEILQRNV